MISFRYHVVTIVAVFLALGLGVIAGTTVLDQGIVSELRGSIEREKQAVVELQDRVEGLEEEAATLQGFVAEARAHLVSGKLDSLPVLLVSHEGADPAAVSEARTALSQAGA